MSEVGPGVDIAHRHRALLRRGRSLRGIDVHTHVPRRGGLAADPRSGQKAQYFKSTTLGMTVEEMVDLYRKLEMIAVVFDVEQAKLGGNDRISVL